MSTIAGLDLPSFSLTPTVARPAPTIASARLARRGVARLIDGVTVAAASLALGGAIGFGPAWLAATTALVYGYHVLFGTTGATPGKRLLGLRVTGPDGAPPSLAVAARREAFVLLGAVPFAGALLAPASWAAIAVTIGQSRSGEGIHDRLTGGTRVVDARPVALRPSA